MPIVLGDPTGLSAVASSSFNHYLLVILWSWQFFDIIISDLVYLGGMFASLIFSSGVVFWYAGLLFAGCVWCTWTIIKEVKLFRKGELGTTIYYHFQVKKSVFIFVKFVLHLAVLAASKQGLFEGVRQFVTWVVVVVVPFWGALFYAVKIRKEEGEFEEGVVKGIW